MAKISQREKILLGYGSNSGSNSSSRKNSEVDFSDVFGGPPRCSSTYNNELDNMDYSMNDDVYESGDGGFRSSWFGLGEKPVFGDQIGTRKRYPSEDFFDDIFGGDQPFLSCSLSPRIHMPGRNPFSSAPGSRDISPSRPLSPVVEPSASPAKFSLPSKVPNTDIRTSTSMNQSSRSFGRSLSRLSQSFHRQSDSYGEARSSYRPPSSHLVDGNKEPFLSDDNFKETLDSNESIQFHFSIYKWASKGVPITIPSSKKRTPPISNGKVDVILSDDSVSGSKRRLPSTLQVNECKSDAKEVKQEVVDESQKSLEGNSLNSSSNMAAKSSMRSLGSLFGEDKQEEKIATTKKGEKQSMVNETKKARLKDNTFSTNYKLVKTKVNESWSSRVKKEVDKSQGSAKVKDFVKIYNKESSSKVKTNVEGQSRSWRWKDTTTTTTFVKTTFPTKDDDDDDEPQASFVNLGKTWSDPIEVDQVVDAESYLSGEQHDTIPNNANDFGNKEPNIDSVKAPPPTVNATSVDDILGNVENLDDESTESQEETKGHERKVKQWSKGKEGNIRALLSTMQYVLWPNSGWKPIPLVDIIEGNAVKKAYQRALLCLHPDKLQQKGAAPHQKFIAEKVFDILQEAWEQFNTIGLL